MATATNLKGAGPERRGWRNLPRWCGWLCWIGLGILVAGVLFFVALALAIHRAQPILKARVMDTLSTRFNARVELKDFEVSPFRGFEVTGGGLKLYSNSLPSPEPMFEVERFSFHTPWLNLLRSPMYISQVHVSGLQIHLPPRGTRGRAPLSNSKDRRHRIKIAIGEMQVENAVLTVATSKAGKAPLEFDISKLQLDTIGRGQPMKFHAALTNPKPVGQIETEGEFGPFQQDSPGDTPVRGVYSFDHADLGTFKGIGGILSSKGQYQGILGRISVSGETDTPDFRLDTANRPMPLHTRFQAVVDGTNGDTYLQTVDAMLNHSHIVARGDVVRVATGHGHDIHLDVTVGPADIQDLLQLAVKTEPPLMDGRLQMHTSFVLPPGDISVTKKLALAGTFVLTGTHFNNARFQSDVDQLSLRSQGKSSAARSISKAKKQGQEIDYPEVASEMGGSFTLGDGKLGLSKIEYSVPGAEIALQGVYSLDGKQLELHGMVRTDAKASQMVTGWKSLLLKPVDHFLAKGGAGMEVPIQVTGTRSEPHFGLDFHNKAQDEKLLNQKP